MVSGSPSGSLSLAKTFRVAGTFLLVLIVSSFAIGGSSSGLTVMFTTAVAVPPFPSSTRKTKLSGPA